MKKLYLMAICLSAIISISANANELSVTDKGLASISATVRFNKKEIQGLLPDYAIKTGKDYIEDEEFPIFVVVDKNGNTLATINPTEDRKRIFSIRIKSSKVRNILGPKIGMTYENIYGDIVNKSCAPGIEQMSGTVICNDPKSQHIAYVFEGQNEGPDGVIPNIGVLKKFKIVEIVWRNLDE